jgi:tetratricopeptide (TPR) repeat protein
MKRIFNLTITLLLTFPGYCQTAQEYYNRAKIKLNFKDYTGAFEEYTKAIQLNPNFSEAYCNRGWVIYTQKQYRIAIVDFTKAIELDRKYEEAYYYRGLAYCSIVEFKSAIADFNKVIKLNPKNSDAYFDRGLAKRRLSHVHSAYNDLFKAVEVDPNNINIYLRWANFENDYKDFSGAINWLTKYLACDSLNSIVYYNRGMAKLNLHEQTRPAARYSASDKEYKDEAKKAFNDQISDFTKAIELDPIFAEAYYYRGLAKLKLDSKDSGCLDLSKAGELGYSKAYEAIEKYCQ